MRMLIVGAGATGGFFGSRLLEAGRDVTFLVRRARRDALARDGLRIVAPEGETVVAPPMLLAGELREPFDAVLLTVKAYGLDAAIADMRAAVGPDTAILPVLNGMGHMDRLREAFPVHNVMGSLARVSAFVDGGGVIRKIGPLQDLVYGEMSGERTQRAAAIDAFLTGAGFEARLSDAILPEMWAKWTSSLRSPRSPASCAPTSGRSPRRRTAQRWRSASSTRSSRSSPRSARRRRRPRARAFWRC